MTLETARFFFLLGTTLIAVGFFSMAVAAFIAAVSCG